MEQLNIEDIKLRPEDILGASFKDSEICKLTVNQLKFCFKCRRVNQGGNKKVLYERYTCLARNPPVENSTGEVMTIDQ